MDLIDGSLKQRRDMLELKIARRQETLIRKHKHKCAQELKSAMFRSDFTTVVKASEEGNISLNYEDADTGMTPLIRAAMEDIHSSIHAWYTNSVDERVTAVAYLLDRISIHRPNVDYVRINQDIPHCAGVCLCTYTLPGKVGNCKGRE